MAPEEELLSTLQKKSYIIMNETYFLFEVVSVMVSEEIDGVSIDSNIFNIIEYVISLGLTLRNSLKAT